MTGIGTILNVATVSVGGAFGLLLGHRLSDSSRRTVLTGLGLCSMALGVKMAFASQNFLIVIMSVLAGGIIGNWLGIEMYLATVGDRLQVKVARNGSPQARVTEAFVASSVLFCVGPLATLGAIQDGLFGDYKLLAMKSLLDGFSAMAFTAAMGWGVLLSVISIIAYQGGLTMAAFLLAGMFPNGLPENNPAVVELGATGGVLVLAIGLGLADIKRIPVADYLPALAIAPAIVLGLHWLGIAV
ncbi:MAG: DUF554 domain-containing protein [Candidatus Hydrogenedentes bacterium]|nr:DUF554 domain-containing protein [Candidatus Hydrogenedentota bacterium]